METLIFKDYSIKKSPTQNKLNICQLGFLFILLLSFITGLSHATRYRHLSMGEYIEMSELIVIGDTYEDEQDKFIKITQVLKGDKSWRHKTVSLTNKHLDNPGKITITGAYRFPPIGEKNMAVLYSKS